jgi:hypothetical protein
MLKGKALEERARELNIVGRSRMNAADLRSAIANAEANRQTLADKVAEGQHAPDVPTKYEPLVKSYLRKALRQKGKKQPRPISLHERQESGVQPRRWHAGKG